jgi:hypothetical protein
MEERGIDEKDVDLYYIKKKRIKIKRLKRPLTTEYRVVFIRTRINPLQGFGIDIPCCIQGYKG